jgi:hypothetical protein
MIKTMLFKFFFRSFFVFYCNRSFSVHMVRDMSMEDLKRAKFVFSPRQIYLYDRNECNHILVIVNTASLSQYSMLILFFLPNVIVRKYFSNIYLDRSSAIHMIKTNQIVC